MLLNSLWVKEEITMEIRKYFENTSASENMHGIQLQSCFRRKYIALIHILSKNKA